MSKWEYLTGHMAGTDLGARGQEGWELVAVHDGILFLKRLVGEVMPAPAVPPAPPLPEPTPEPEPAPTEEVPPMTEPVVAVEETGDAVAAA